MNDKPDIVLINPGDRRQVYQELGIELMAVEPPFWIASISAFLRQCGFSVAIIDSNADNITPEETSLRAREMDPLLIAVIVYGSNPSASTPNMTVSGKICAMLKSNTSSKVAIGGLHPSALPKRTLKENDVDFVIQGEGPYTLKSLIETLKAGKADYSGVPGLWYKENGSIKSTPTSPLIKNLDETLPIGAWDLLPMDKYRAHNWHCFDDINNRMPYGVIYTSLGCPYSCNFCCINAPFGKPGIRYRSPKLVIAEIGVLVEQYGVKNLKIADELFVLRESHYMAIVELIIEKGYSLNIWAYARVDSINPENLKTMKKAGINWLGLGIESANRAVLDGVHKQMKSGNIKYVVDKIKEADICVGANYIFGLPDDTVDTMQETVETALTINSEWANFYCAMAYPGSKLYDTALSEGWTLPSHWHEYSQLSYETTPLQTKYLSASDVLKFRDNAFDTYFKNPKYIEMIEQKFGKDVKRHIEKMTTIKLKRKLLGDYP